MTQMTTRESFTRLAVILGTAQYNENGIATISREMVGEIQLTLKDAQAEIDALTAERDEARAQIAVLQVKAEAWDTLEAYREAERNGTSEQEEDARWKHIPVRDRARAAAARAREVNRG